MSDAVHSAVLVVAAMCAFIVAFSASWAGVFWVLMSEIFSMPVKSPAVAAATAALFLVGAPVPPPLPLRSPSSSRAPSPAKATL